MKKHFFILFASSLFLVSCGNNAEVERLKKENAILATQIQSLKSGVTGQEPKYILKIRLKQSHFSLSIKKHIKDAVNAIDFELPVDKEFYNSVSEGTKLVDKFRFGSLILSGSFGDWEMKVKGKEVRQR